MIEIQSEDELLESKTRERVLKAILSEDNVRRRNNALKRNEVFMDRTREHVLQLAKKEFATDAFLEMSNRTPNISICKKIVKKIARVYKNAPVRELIEDKEPVKDQSLMDKAKAAALRLKDKVTGDDGVEKAEKATQEAKQAKLDELVDDLELNIEMKNANRGVVLQHNFGVSVLPQKDFAASRQAGKDLFGIGADGIDPSLFDVIPSPDDPKKALGVVLSYHYRATQSGVTDYRSGDGRQGPIAEGSRDQGKGQTPSDRDRRYIWWTDSYNFTTDENGRVVKVPFPEDGTADTVEGLKLAGRNAIKEIPYVFFHKGQQMLFWAEGGEDIVDTSILVNLLLADVFFLAKYQGMGIFYMFGKNLPKEIKWGPNRLLTAEVEPGETAPSVGFASTNPPIDAHLNMILTLVALLLTTNDLEPGAISGKLEAGNAASGIQELIQRSEPTNAVEDDQELFKRREPRIVRLAIAWLKVLGESKSVAPSWEQYVTMDENTDYSIKYPPTQAFVSEKERIEIQKAKKDLGTVTLVDILMALNEDLTLEQAQAKALELFAEAQSKAAAFGLPVNGKPGDKKPAGEGDDDDDDEEKKKNNPPPVPPNADDDDDDEEKE